MFFVYAKQRFWEKTHFKKNSNWRFRTLLAALTLIVVGSAYLFKLKAQSDTWACLLQDANLYSGIGEDYSLNAKLPQGACVKVVKLKEGWISLSPEYSAGGWTQKASVQIVRGKL